MMNIQAGQGNVAVVRMLERFADVISETEVNPGHRILKGDVRSRIAVSELRLLPAFYQGNATTGDTFNRICQSGPNRSGDSR